MQTQRDQNSRSPLRRYQDTRSGGGRTKHEIKEGGFTQRETDGDDLNHSPSSVLGIVRWLMDDPEEVHCEQRTRNCSVQKYNIYQK